MGMYDSFSTGETDEWQTKALGRQLRWWSLGDAIPGPRIDYQIEVIGGLSGETRWAYVTLNNGQFDGVTNERDTTVPLLLYSGHWIPEGN